MAVDIQSVLKRAGQAERIRLAKAQIASRQAVSDARKNILLNPEDVAGEYNFKRVLMTTLGGKPRPITLQDLKQFEHVARKLGKKYVKKGITAAEVIEFSRAVDRQRSQAQIHTAPIIRAQQGLLTFVTNAGPDSEHQRHYVRVRFPAFEAYVAAPKTRTNDSAFKAARELTKGPLQFDCTCERHRYVFRYIATKGGFNIGPPLGYTEAAFPKITNPTLEGIACKHVLRVMKQISAGGSVAQFVATALLAAQKKATVAVTATAAEAREAAKQQLDTRHHLKNRVESTVEKRARIDASAGGKRRAMMAAIKAAQAKVSNAKNAAEKTIEQTMANLKNAVLTKDQKARLLAIVKAMKVK
jgi:hypothetical protein